MKKKILLALVLIVSIFIVNVNAKQFIAKEKINLSEQQDYSVFAAGSEVNISSFIDGASFVAGEDVNLSSSQDVMFVAGEEIKINDAYTKDAFLAGTDIEINNSQIRDLYAFAEEIELNSNISHNAYLAGTKVVISSEIMGNLNIAAEEIVITDTAVIHGTLNYPEYAYANISNEAKIEREKTYKADPETTAISVKTQIENFVSSYLSITVIALLLVWLFKKQFKALEKEEFTVKNIAKKTALGFAALIVIPIAAIILMFTIIGMPLSIIALLLYGILIYLSIIPSGYLVAHKILGDKIKNEYAIIAIGILAIKLLEFIPFVGGFVVFISLCFGLWTMINIKKTAK